MVPGTESRLTRWLLTRWYGGRPPALLLPLATLFGLVTALRRSMFRHGGFRRHSMPVAVIVVGNLLVGGAGKTPTVAAVVDGLQRRGRRPGVVCRGYGGSITSARLLEADTPAAECGDEPLLLKRRLQVPVAIGRDRPAAARLLLARHPEVDCLVCDDGLQHYALARDIELVVIDRARGFGNGALLPAGPLREKPGRLRQASAVIWQGPRLDTRVAEALEAQLPAAMPTWTLELEMAAPRPLQGGTTRPWSDWMGVRVHAAAGIASPTRFFAGLRAHGLALIEHAFPDHFAFQAADLAFTGDEPILMTEKDAVKCEWASASDTACRYWVVPLDAHLSEPFFDWLITRLEQLRGSETA